MKTYLVTAVLPNNDYSEIYIARAKDEADAIAQANKAKDENWEGPEPTSFHAVVVPYVEGAIGSKGVPSEVASVIAQIQMAKDNCDGDCPTCTKRHRSENGPFDGLDLELLALDEDQVSPN